jgi:hypothetical protein
MHGSRRRGLETEQTWHKDTGVAQPTGKPAEERPQALNVSEPPRQPPTLHGARSLAA